MSSKGKVVIVKKVIKGGGGAHGGSWKVAMADLALAMMALFMVLWLLSVTDEEQLENITAYFKDPGRLPAFRLTSPDQAQWFSQYGEGSQ